MSKPKKIRFIIRWSTRQSLLGTISILRRASGVHDIKPASWQATCTGWTWSSAQSRPASRVKPAGPADWGKQHRLPVSCTRGATMAGLRDATRKGYILPVNLVENPLIVDHFCRWMVVADRCFQNRERKTDVTKTTASSTDKTAFGKWTIRRATVQAPPPGKCRWLSVKTAAFSILVVLRSGARKRLGNWE